MFNTRTPCPIDRDERKHADEWDEDQPEQDDTLEAIQDNRYEEMANWL